MRFRHSLSVAVCSMLALALAVAPAAAAILGQGGPEATFPTQKGSPVQVTDAYRPLDSLRPHLRNYNRHTEAQIARFADQVRHTAFTAPIICTPDGTVLAGHRRRLGLLRLQAEGYPEPDGVQPGWRVPCRVVDCTEVQALALLAGDNPDRNELDYDATGLANILSELQASGDLIGAGYTAERLDSLIGEVTAPAAKRSSKKQSADSDGNGGEAGDDGSSGPREWELSGSIRGFERLSFKLSTGQAARVKQALDSVASLGEDQDPENPDRNANALAFICEAYLNGDC